MDKFSLLINSKLGCLTYSISYRVVIIELTLFTAELGLLTL